MKAIEYDRYGTPEVLTLREVEVPEAGRGQVRVRVRAAALNPKDCLVRKGRFRNVTGKKFPRRAGYDFAGEVDAVGSGVNDMAIGDAVFGMLNGWAGGTHAEYVVASWHELAHKPPAIDFADAAGIPLAAQTALQALRDLGRSGPGRHVLINGCGGGVGTLAVQLATILGARVTGVCSAANAEQARQLGAAEVIDYTQTEISRAGARFDTVFDVFGNLDFRQARALLRPGGIYISTVPSAGIVLAHLATRLLPPPLRRARLVVVKSRHRDLVWLAEQMDAGRLRPVTDRTWPLAQAAEAHAYQETRRARGKVVLTVD